MIFYIIILQIKIINKNISILNILKKFQLRHYIKLFIILKIIYNLNLILFNIISYYNM